MSCTKAPAGWHCTRDAGHDGPCAAVPDDALPYRAGTELNASHVEFLDRTFTYHAPKDDQPGRYEHIRAEARRFAQVLLVQCPGSRELVRALEKLDEAVMLANAAIARNE